MNLKLVEYIKSNQNWEHDLTEKPYCIIIKREDTFIIFNYNQIESDFNEPIVRECRGIILEDNTFNPVCVPFFKFGNYGEGYADKIDSTTARVEEKVDGSLIKVWYYKDRWIVSTNSTIYAWKADTPSYLQGLETFNDIFTLALENCEFDWNILNPNYTYMFELISPYNRVVVPYENVDIVHIGTRNNITLEELDIDIGIRKPKQYYFDSIEHCIETAKELPFSQEGYVVVDQQWRRNKIKSPAYVAAHHLKNNGIVTRKRIVSLIRLNEHEEFLSYYPEYQNNFNIINNKIKIFCNDMNWYIDTAKINFKLYNRKQFAEFAKTTKCPSLLFCWLDNKCKTAEDWLWSQTDEKIIKWIGD